MKGKEIDPSQPSIEVLKKLGVKTIRIKENIKIPKKDIQALNEFLTKKREEEKRVYKKMVEGKI